MHFSKSVIKKETVALPCLQGQPQTKMLDKHDTLDHRMVHFVSSLSFYAGKINKGPKSSASRWAAIHMCTFTELARVTVPLSPLACARLSGQVGKTQSSCRKDLGLKAQCLKNYTTAPTQKFSIENWLRMQGCILFSVTLSSKRREVCVKIWFSSSIELCH